MDDNSFHYLPTADTTLVFVEHEERLVQAAQPSIGDMVFPSIFALLPVRVARQVRVLVTDASANQASCNISIYITAPVLTPSLNVIAMTTLTTSATR
jgi:hypothetical protein